MKNAKQPLAAYVLDALGILAWLCAALLGYREETFTTTVSGGDGIEVPNFLLMHVQMEMLIVCCALSIIGTILLCVSALVKRIHRADITSPGS